jgi:hypothetical protein
VSAAVAVAAPRATRRALAVVGSADAPLIALCAKLQAALVTTQCLEADPASTGAALIRAGEKLDAMLGEIADLSARTRVGRHAKAALALDVLLPDNLNLLHGAVAMDLLEGLARDMLAEGAQ